MQERICKNCNKNFLFRISKGSTRGKYCSVPCQRKKAQTSVVVSCKNCTKEFKVQPHRFSEGRGRYCSVACSHSNMYTDEVRKNMSLKRRGKPVPARQGANCHFWRGGVTPKSKSDRTSLSLRIWRESVFTRDNWTCVLCKTKGGILNADHIKTFSKFPELRFEINNGRTLCLECHKKTDTYGGKANKRQITVKAIDHYTEILEEYKKLCT